MTMPGLPSSSPVGSNHSGAGIGILPDWCSVDSTSHSVARSVSMIAWPGRRVLADDVAAALASVLHPRPRHLPAVAAGDQLVVDHLDAVGIVAAASEERLEPRSRVDRVGHTAPCSCRRPAVAQSRPQLLCLSVQ